MYLRGATSKGKEGKGREEKGEGREGKGLEGRTTLHTPCRKFLATPLALCVNFDDINWITIHEPTCFTHTVWQIKSVKAQRQTEAV